VLGAAPGPPTGGRDVAELPARLGRDRRVKIDDHAGAVGIHRVLAEGLAGPKTDSLVEPSSRSELFVRSRLQADPLVALFDHRGEEVTDERFPDPVTAGPFRRPKTKF
jgi:hypothetical protein